MAEQTNMQSPLVCDLTAIDPAQRTTHQALSAHLLTQAAQEIHELPDGYAFSFPAELYTEVVTFIAHERLCCQFFTFVLEVSPDHGPICLRITGRDGVKEVFRSLLDALPAGTSQ